MYKNQLQELAQRSCFNLPAYSCIREGPDHAPRFKATVNFSGETFESPSFCTTLRQAEHSAAEVALNALATRGPSHSLAARILDETGVYKNLLQEVSQRVGASLPKYSTFRARHGYLPVFSCTVELAGVRFTGEPAKTKKQAEKNAAMTAWTSLKLLVPHSEGSSSERANNDEQEHVTVARALQLFLARAKMSNVSFPITCPAQSSAGPPLITQRPSIRTSKILPFITSRTPPRGRPLIPSATNNSTSSNSGPDRRPPSLRVNDRPTISQNVAFDSLAAVLTANDVPIPRPESPIVRPHQKFPAAEAAPYIPFRHFRPPRGIAPPVTMRNAIPVFSAPPRPPPPSHHQSPQFRSFPQSFRPPPVCVRQVVPAFAAAPVGVMKDQPVSVPQPTPPTPPPPPTSSSPQLEKTEVRSEDQQKDSALVQDLQELKV